MMLALLLACAASATQDSAPAPGAKLVAPEGFAVDLIDSFRSTKTVDDEQQISKMALAFVGAPFPDDYNVLRVPGWVDNRSKQDFKTVTIEIQLLDEKKAKKEKVTYEVADVPAGTRKTFDVNAGTLPSTREATIQIVKVEVVQ